MRCITNNHLHSKCLTKSTGHTQNDTCQQSWQSCWNNDTVDGLPASGTECIGGFTQSFWQRGQCICHNTCYRRKNHYRENKTSGCNPDACSTKDTAQQRYDDAQTDKSVYNGWNSGQEFNRRLQDLLPLPGTISVMKSAAHRPSGLAINAASKVVMKEPVMNGNAP